jgi:hypothetical protein
MVRNARFLKAAELRETYFPVPESGTFCIPPFPLSVIVSVPSCLVAALGVNVTEIEHDAPAARLAGQLLVCLNTPKPASEIISINTGSPGCFFLPLGLDTLTFLGLLGVPTVVFENFSDFGLIFSVTATGVGVAVGVAVAVPPVEVAVAVAVAVLVAVAVAVGVPPVDVAVAVAVEVLVAVAVAVGVPPVDVAVAVAVAVPVAVAVGVAVLVAVDVAEAVAVAVGVDVAVAGTCA